MLEHLSPPSCPDAPRLTPALRTVPASRSARSTRRGRRGWKRRKRQALVDPATGSGVRDWNRAVELIREFKLPTPIRPTAKPQVSLDNAIASFLAFKSRRSLDVQRKSKLVLGRARSSWNSGRISHAGSDIHGLGGVPHAVDRILLRPSAETRK